MWRVATGALCLAILACAAPCFAQSVAEGQSCGGLLCDMGVFGHKTPPTTNADVPPPNPAPVKQVEATPLPEPAPERVSPPPKKAIVPKRRIAKVVTKLSPASHAAATRPSGPSVATPASKPQLAAQAAKPAKTSGNGSTAASSPAAPPPAPAFNFRPLYNF